MIEKRLLDAVRNPWIYKAFEEASARGPAGRDR
jgi:hypothetical protein